MWKSVKREDEKPNATSVPSIPAPTPSFSEPKKEFRPMDSLKHPDSFRADVAHIGKSVIIRGELSGSEDLYLDGEVEGSIDLIEHSLVIGPNGRIRASIAARELVLHGKVEGNVQAT